MSPSDRRIRTENGESYRLIEMVGRGALATVWKAEREDGSLAAVKVPLRALHPDLRRQFDTEVETLRKILTLDVPWPAGENLPPVPSFALRGEPDVLVLEWIHVPTLASQVQGEADLPRRQDQVIEPAYQYVWFMDFLHSRLGIGQRDRKLGDLYWDRENKRLVVLDWNAVSGAERAAEDIYKFGEMWYALLLGRAPVLGADLAANVGWEQLSAAWRSVLSICLRSDRTARPSGRELLGMVSDLRDDYGKEPGVLLQEGRAELEEARSSLETTAGRTEVGAWEKVERARLKLDLANQMGFPEGARLAVQAQEVLDTRRQAALKNVKGSLELSRSDDALKALTQAEAELGSDPEGQLRVARWRCLYDAWQASRQEELAAELRNQMILLTSFVERLEKGEWASSGAPLSSDLRDLEGSRTYELLIGLEAESDLRRLLREALNEREEGLYRQASARYGEAQELLQRIAYREALAATIIDLNDAQAECDHLARTEGRLQEILLHELPQAIAEARYGSAHRLYSEALPLTGADPEARRELNKAFAPVQGLEALDQARQQPDLPAGDLVRQANALLNRFPDNKAVQRAAVQIITCLLPGLERQAGAAKRPTDVKTALDLGHLLQGLSESSRMIGVDPPAADRCQRVVETLERKLSLQRGLRSQYEEGDNQAKQQAIDEAEQGGIELFDDPALSVAHLHEAVFVEQESARLAWSWQNYEARREQTELMKDEIRHLIKGFKQVDRVLADLGKREIPQKRTQLQQELAEIRPLVAEIRELPDAETLARQLREVDLWEHEIGRMQEIRRHYESLQVDRQQVQEQIRELDGAYRRLRQAVEAAEAQVIDADKLGLQRQLDEWEALTTKARKLRDHLAQLLERQDLVWRVLPQIYLDQTLAAVRHFRLEEAASHLGDLQDCVKKDPETLQKAYQDWIAFLEREITFLEGLEDQDLKVLASWRVAADRGETLPAETMENLDRLEWTISRSAFVAELWNQAQQEKQAATTLLPNHAFGTRQPRRPVQVLMFALIGVSLVVAIVLSLFLIQVTKDQRAWTTEVRQLAEDQRDLATQVGALTMMFTPSPASGTPVLGSIRFNPEWLKLIAGHQVEVVIQALDDAGDPVQDAVLALRMEPLTDGLLERSAVNTGGDGQAEVRYVAGQMPGTVTLVAEAQDGSGIVETMQIEIVPDQNKLIVLASESELLATGTDETLLTVHLLDALDTPLVSVPVTMTLVTGDGQFLNAQGQSNSPPWQAVAAKTNEDGRVEVAFRAGTLPGVAVIRVTAGDLVQMIEISLTEAQPAALTIVLVEAQPKPHLLMLGCWPERAQSREVALQSHSAWRPTGLGVGLLPSRLGRSAHLLAPS